MSPGRLPIRVRLTAAFAAAMLLMLAGAAAFVYARLRADLDDAINDRLQVRADVVAAQSSRGPLKDVALEDPEENFVQILSPDGGVLDAAGGADGPALSAQQVRAAMRGRLLTERKVPGIEGQARVLARPLRGDAGPVVVVVGHSLNDRDEALSSVVTSFVVGGGVAVLLASAVGYLLARAGLAPMEAMRRRALRVSLTRADEGLPLPAAHDEVRRLGETLNAMLDRLRASFDRERRFVADASHELRTPVAVVRTEIETALAGGENTPDVREGLVAALDECDRLAQLIDDLLVMARLAEDGLPLRTETVHPQALLGGVRDRFADRAAQRGRAILVRISESADGHALRADPERLRQALGNLVDNSLRHGAGDVTLAYRRTGEGSDLEVSDRGTGFPPDLAEHAFERFTRGDAARTGEGSGLGLAIVQAVARSHGGDAQIVPGEGATVRIRLPEQPH